MTRHHQSWRFDAVAGLWEDPSYSRGNSFREAVSVYCIVTSAKLTSEASHLVRQQEQNHGPPDGLMQAAQVALSRADAGALLLVCLWGCVSARLGIRIERGGRHLLASLAVTALLIGAYEGIRLLA